MSGTADSEMLLCQATGNFRIPKDTARVTKVIGEISGLLLYIRIECIFPDNLIPRSLIPSQWGKCPNGIYSQWSITLMCVIRQYVLCDVYISTRKAINIIINLKHDLGTWTLSANLVNNKICSSDQGAHNYGNTPTCASDQGVHNYGNTPT